MLNQPNDIHQNPTQADLGLPLQNMRDRCNQLIERAHNALSREKIYGVLHGIMLGDALGLPVETYSSKEIAERFGRVTNFLDPNLNVFMRELDAPQVASTSDDLQLTLAGLKATFEFPEDGSRFDMDPVVQTFLEAFEQTDLGWGKSTRNAAKALKAGVPWQELSQLRDWNGKTGNGIPMKIAGFALHAAATQMDADVLIKGIEEVALLSHRSSDGISSGLTHTFALLYFLGSTPESFSKEAFLQLAIDISTLAERFLPESKGEYTLATRLRMLEESKNWEPPEAEKLFNGGNSEVRDSLPFTYAYVLKEPATYRTIENLVNAGGDTDSTAALAGGLIGALCGKEVFPQNLISQIPTQTEVNKFVEKFVLQHKIQS